MAEKNMFRFGPTRRELWFWLWVSAAILAGVGVAILLHGLPSGPALVEVVGLPVAAFGFLGARSAKRLIRRQHP